MKLTLHPVVSMHMGKRLAGIAFLWNDGTRIATVICAAGSNADVLEDGRALPGERAPQILQGYDVCLTGGGASEFEHYVYKDPTEDGVFALTVIPHVDENEWEFLPMDSHFSRSLGGTLRALIRAGGKLRGAYPIIVMAPRILQFVNCQSVQCKRE